MDNIYFHPVARCGWLQLKGSVTWLPFQRRALDVGVEVRTGGDVLFAVAYESRGAAPKVDRVVPR